MRLLIDIPERDYKNVSRIVDMGFGTNVDEAIKNGIPLDDVKAEIMTETSNPFCNGDYQNGLGKALEIIDKHIADMR